MNARVAAVLRTQSVSWDTTSNKRGGKEVTSLSPVLFTDIVNVTLKNCQVT